MTRVAPLADAELPGQGDTTAADINNKMLKSAEILVVIFQRVLDLIDVCFELRGEF